MPDSLDWLQQHVEVLYDTDRTGRIARVNEPDPESDPPHLFIALGRTATLVAFGIHVPDEVASRLGVVANALPAWSGGRTDGRILDPLREAVQAEIGPTVESHGPAFRFGDSPTSPAPMVDAVLIDDSNASVLDANFPYTRSVLEWRSPVAGVTRDGVVVSACYSARRRATACEAGVDTQEAYRGAGMAVAAVAAWARAAKAIGMTPLYSTTWDNAASLRVAAKLGLEAYADTLSFG